MRVREAVLQQENGRALREAYYAGGVSSEEDPVAWLRETIEDNLAAARIINAGGFSPQWWDTEPPGQVNPDDIPQSAAVTAALGCAPEYICGWVQLVAYDKLNNEPDEAYGRDSEAPFALVDNGRREVDHIARHDPRNEVARCEAELAILDEHDAAKARRAAEADDYAAWVRGEAPVDRPVFDGPDSGLIAGLERTVRLLIGGYRHCEGYREEWGT